MDNLSILVQMASDVQADIIHSMQEKDRVATGETVKSLEIIQASVEGKNGDLGHASVQLLANKSIEALELGRSPTSPNAQAGDPTVYERIQVWAEARGIDEFGTNEKGKTVNVWRAITAKIHKEGFKGTPGVLTEPLGDDNLNRHSDKAAEGLAQLAGQKIIDAFALLDEA